MKLGLDKERSPAPTKVRVPSKIPYTPQIAAKGRSLPLLHLMLVLPLIAFFGWAAVYFNDVRLDSKDADAARPLFSQYRPVRIDDLNPDLRRRMIAEYGEPIELRLEKSKGVIQLRVYHGRRVVRQRPVIAGDLDQTGLLQRYIEKTGDQADTVDIRYRRGKPFVMIYSSSDAEGG